MLRSLMASQATHAEQALELTEAVRAGARSAVIERLCEVVSWPESRIPVFERQLAADILLDLLRTSSAELRQRCAEGLVRLADPPKALLRYLARDEINVAGPLLENSAGFSDSDLIDVVRAGVKAHWLVIARRRGLSEPVTDALMQTSDPAVIEAVLRNNFTKLSSVGVEMAVARSKVAPQLAGLLTQRQELRPNEALALFWWADFAARVHILRRFAIDRATLIQELSETFGLAAQEGWGDAEARKALQVIERRQRNRAAATQSHYQSVENAIAEAANGMGADFVSEVGHMSGVKPMVAAQIFTDPGGEAIAVLAKAIGLRRPMFLALWKVLQRPQGDMTQTDNPLGRTLYIYDTLATAKAQTVLRYWNWSLSARMAPDDDAPLTLEADAAVRRGPGGTFFRRS